MNRTLPARADRIAALHRIAPLTRWEPASEEMYLTLTGAARLGLDTAGCHEAVWVRTYHLASAAALRHLWPYLTAPHAEPTALDYATERAARSWALVTADRIADQWVSLAPEAEQEAE